MSPLEEIEEMSEADIKNISELFIRKKFEKTDDANFIIQFGEIHSFCSGKKVIFTIQPKQPDEPEFELFITGEGMVICKTYTIRAPQNVDKKLN